MACVVGAVSVGVVSGSAVASSSSQRGSLAVVRVASTPKGKGALSMRHLNTVIASSSLAFTVSLHNFSARRHLKVTVSVTRPRSSQGSLVRSRAVWLGATRSGAVKVGPFMPILFAERSRVKVSVFDPRTREVWTTVYPVIFSLG